MNLVPDPGTCLWLGFGTRYYLRFLPTQAILWFWYYCLNCTWNDAFFLGMPPHHKKDKYLQTKQMKPDLFLKTKLHSHLILECKLFGAEQSTAAVLTKEGSGHWNINIPNNLTKEEYRWKWRYLGVEFLIETWYWYA